MCGGKGCRDCKEGYFEIQQCPYEYIGRDLVDTINLASMCGKGDWPVAGGLLCQSAWFIQLVQYLQNEIAHIENEMIKDK